MADVFVGCACEDEARVAALVQALQRHGLTVFWDRQIPPGKTWRDHIGRSLADVRCVVVAWSTHSVASDFVAEKADDARQRGVLVPVRIDDVLPPLGFRSVQAADLRELDEAAAPRGIEGFLNAVDAVLGRAPSADAAAHAPIAPAVTAAPPAHAAPPAPPASSAPTATAARPPADTPAQEARRIPGAWPLAAAAALVLAMAIGWIWMRGAPAPPAADAGRSAPAGRGAAPPGLRVVDAWRTDDGGVQVKVMVLNRGAQAVTFEARRACALVGPGDATQLPADSRPLFETLPPGESATFELSFGRADGDQALRCRVPGGEVGEAHLPPLR